MVKLSKQKLVAALIENGISVTEFAKRAGFSRQRASLLVNRGGNIGTATIYKLAVALGVSPFSLMDDSESALEYHCASCNTEKIERTVAK